MGTIFITFFWLIILIINIASYFFNRTKLSRNWKIFHLLEIAFLMILVILLFVSDKYKW